MRGAIPPKSKCASPYSGVQAKISKCAFRYSGPRRAQKFMKQINDVRGSSQHTKIMVLPQFWTSDQHVTKWLPVDGKNLRFTTVVDVRRPRSDEKVRGRTDKFAFTTLLSVRRARSDERVASATSKICISPRFLNVQ